MTAATLPLPLLLRNNANCRFPTLHPTPVPLRCRTSCPTSPRLRSFQALSRHRCNMTLPFRVLVLPPPGLAAPRPASFTRFPPLVPFACATHTYLIYAHTCPDVEPIERRERIPLGSKSPAQLYLHVYNSDSRRTRRRNDPNKPQNSKAQCPTVYFASLHVQQPECCEREKRYAAC